MYIQPSQDGFLEVHADNGKTYDYRNDICAYIVRTDIPSGKLNEHFLANSAAQGKMRIAVIADRDTALSPIRMVIALSGEFDDQASASKALAGPITLQKQPAFDQAFPAAAERVSLWARAQNAVLGTLMPQPSAA